MKIAFCTAVWKRPEVFPLFAKGIETLRESTNLDVAIIVAGSEGIKSRSMVEQYPYHYIEVKNDPLATKMNATTLYAREIGADYVMCLGSDDIIHPNLFAHYETQMHRGTDYTAVLDFYFFDIRSRKSVYWAGYRDPRRKGHTCGAGRLISARLMDKWGWAPWQVEHSHILDNSMQQKLATTPHSEHIFSCLAHGVHGLDIKSSTNMTPFAVWDNACEIDPLIIKNQFPYVWDSRSN